MFIWSIWGRTLYEIDALCTDQTFTRTCGLFTRDSRSWTSTAMVLLILLISGPTQRLPRIRCLTGSSTRSIKTAMAVSASSSSARASRCLLGPCRRRQRRVPDRGRPSRVHEAHLGIHLGRRSDPGHRAPADRVRRRKALARRVQAGHGAIDDTFM